MLEDSMRCRLQVTLYCDCPFWPDDGMCAMRDCSVCECPPDEVPQLWKDAEASSNGTCLSGEDCVFPSQSLEPHPHWFAASDNDAEVLFAA